MLFCDFCFIFSLVVSLLITHFCFGRGIVSFLFCVCVTEEFLLWCFCRPSLVFLFLLLFLLFECFAFRIIVWLISGIKKEAALIFIAVNCCFVVAKLSSLANLCDCREFVVNSASFCLVIIILFCGLSCYLSVRCRFINFIFLFLLVFL